MTDTSEFRGVKAKKVQVYISKEAPRPFSLSPLDLLCIVTSVLLVNKKYKKNILDIPGEIIAVYKNINIQEKKPYHNIYLKIHVLLEIGKDLR